MSSIDPIDSISPDGRPSPISDQSEVILNPSESEETDKRSSGFLSSASVEPVDPNASVVTRQEMKLQEELRQAQFLSRQAQAKVEPAQSERVFTPAEEMQITDLQRKFVQFNDPIKAKELALATFLRVETINTQTLKREAERQPPALHQHRDQQIWTTNLKNLKLKVSGFRKFKNLLSTLFMKIFGKKIGQRVTKENITDQFHKVSKEYPDITKKYPVEERLNIFLNTNTLSGIQDSSTSMGSGVTGRFLSGLASKYRFSFSMALCASEIKTDIDRVVAAKKTFKNIKENHPDKFEDSQPVVIPVNFGQNAFLEAEHTTALIIRWDAITGIYQVTFRDPKGVISDCCRNILAECREVFTPSEVFYSIIMNCIEKKLPHKLFEEVSTAIL